MTNTRGENKRDGNEMCEREKYESKQRGIAFYVERRLDVPFLMRLFLSCNRYFKLKKHCLKLTRKEIFFTAK